MVCGAALPGSCRTATSAAHLSMLLRLSRWKHGCGPKGPCITIGAAGGCMHGTYGDVMLHVKPDSVYWNFLKLCLHCTIQYASLTTMPGSLMHMSCPVHAVTVPQTCTQPIPPQGLPHREHSANMLGIEKRLKFNKGQIKFSTTKRTLNH